MITLITPTGGRQKSFTLCEKFIARQTYKGPLQWIVIDDCVPQTLCSMRQEYYRGPKPWKPGVNTQRLNLDFAISKIKGDYVCVIEDDDQYHHQYLESTLDMLKYTPVVGEANAKYYYLPGGCYKEMNNTTHASLCSTAFHKSLLPKFEAAVNSGELYIDVVFWRLIRESNTPYSLRIGSSNLVIGMKGLPGRTGIGVGHTPKGFITDSTDFATLQSWVGSDISLYKEYLPSGKKETKFTAKTA